MLIEELKGKIEGWLKQYFEDKGLYNKSIYEAMNYSLSVGGKRIRPMLLLLAYGLYKEDYTYALEPACAIEMIHTYSLIHDDLPCMDDDDLRRGKPTCHKVFGEALAVLAGDGLLNEAANVLLRFSIGKGEEALRASAVILEASGAEGMIGGQVVDIESENKKIEIDKLNYMHSKKTGALIKASLEAGAILAGAPEQELQKISTLGEKLGLAFQIKDDILDVTGDTSRLGKRVNHDIENNKTTYISVYGLEKCVEFCSSLTMECMEILRELNRSTVYLEKLTEFLLARDY
jgi:farnesyl-diphosphate synthase (EC 2.5.1.10)